MNKKSMLSAAHEFQRIKVLHVTQSLETGGLENGIVNLVNHSDQEQFQVDILCLRATGTLAPRITNTRTQVIFDGNQSESIPVAINKVKAACLAGQYHIVHCHGWATMLAGYIGGKLARAPIIINGEHGTLYFDSWLRRLLQRILFTLMDLNLTVSAALKEEIKKRFGVSGKNFKTIINGVDIQKFSPAATTKRVAIRSSLNLSDSDFVVGTVGRLVEVKNYPCLIRGFSTFAARYPNAKLIFAGDGSQRELLEKLAEELNVVNSIKFLGRRDDIHDLLNAFDVFVLPSFREGLSNTVLEAMACGKPVVVTNVGGNPEIVVDGSNGHLVNVNDATDITERLESFYIDRGKLINFSQNSRNLVTELFSLDGMVKNYENTYLELARSNRILG